MCGAFSSGRSMKQARAGPVISSTKHEQSIVEDGDTSRIYDEQGKAQCTALSLYAEDEQGRGLLSGHLVPQGWPASFTPSPRPPLLDRFMRPSTAC